MYRQDDARTGAPDALWDPTIRKHRIKIRTHLVSRGVPFDDAEELANETWTVLWSRRHQLKDLNEPRLAALARKQAWFLACDRFRRHKPERWIVLDADDLHTGEEPIDAALRGQYPEEPPMPHEQERLRAAIGALPVRWGRVIHAVYFEELDHKSVASKLGISVPRVREILQDARERLRKVYEGGNDGQRG